MFQHTSQQFFLKRNIFCQKVRWFKVVPFDGNPNNFFSEHKNIKLFISHGGLLSVQEAIYHGVPLLGIPLFADQSFNIKRCTQKGIAQAIDLTDITEYKLTRTIADILQNSSYK